MLVMRRADNDISPAILIPPNLTQSVALLEGTRRPEELTVTDGTARARSVTAVLITAPVFGCRAWDMHTQHFHKQD